MDEPASQPDADLSEVAGPAVWDALAREPDTGVSIVDDRGTIVYCNQQAIDRFLEQGRTPDQVIGRDLHSLYPEPFVEERLGVIHRVVSQNKPVLFRSIWRGRQQRSWIYPVHDEAGDPTGRVLIITRRVEGDTTPPAKPTDEAFERVDAEVIDLGPLDILSTRELVVMALLGQGYSLKDTAKKLHRSVRTIESQRDSIARKLQLSDRGALIEIARQVGLRCDDAYRKSV
jgi:DNA-binding CsgD family transcriptional regulator